MLSLFSRCIRIAEWKMFEYFILVTILATCISLALYTPYPNGDSNELNANLESIEVIFMVIFTAESAIKIVAYGMWQHEDAYLRNAANFLDFTIVMIGFFDILMASLNVEGVDAKALRAFRVLRPLRLVSGVPSKFSVRLMSIFQYSRRLFTPTAGLQIVLNAILMAMIPLTHIALLVLFVIIIYAIIGLEMFMGKLHTACFNSQTGELNWLYVIHEKIHLPLISQKNGSNGFCLSALIFPPYSIDELVVDRPCGEGNPCQGDGGDGVDLVCKEYVDGPNFGITNFDNFFVSCLTVFQCVT